MKMAVHIRALLLLALAHAPLAASQAYRIMPLGDSITQWQCDAESQGGWRNFLGQSLHGARVPFVFVGSQYDCGSHEGHSGWTSGQLLALAPSVLPLYSPHVVLLQAGTNDLFFDQGAPGQYPQGGNATVTRDRIAALIAATLSLLPGVRVVLSGVTQINATRCKAYPQAPWHPLPCPPAMPAAISELNGLLAALPAALGPNVSFHDPNPPGGFVEADYWTWGIHFNESGYEKIAAAHFAALRPVVGLAPPPAPCDVSAPPFRAACDGATEDTAALQAALDAPACAAVVVPPRCVALTRGLNLTRMSGRALRIEGTLRVWPDPATYGAPSGGYNNPILAGSYSHAWTGPLLRDFSLSGGGTVLGGGAAWWPAGKTVNRPRTLWLPNASNVAIANLTFVDSPAWNVGVRGTGVRISGMTLTAGAGACGGYGSAPNTDGFNLGGEDIEVADSRVHNGDDCVPVTTGNAGFTRGVYAKNISCSCGTNGGVVYNQGGNVSNVTFAGFFVNGTNQGAGVKLSEPGRDATGGLVEGVAFIDYAIHNPRFAALYINVFGEDSQAPCALPQKPGLENWLTVRGALFRNVTAHAPGAQAGCFRCTPGAPCSMELDGVRVDGARSGWTCLNAAQAVGAGGAAPAACK
jgi:lysophospholipase L1-like esterase